MSLKEQIAGDMIAAMKAKDAARTSTLRMLKSAIGYREIEKGGALDDEELSKLLRSQMKQRRDSVEQYQKGGRQAETRHRQFVRQIHPTEFKARTIVLGTPTLMRSILWIL